LEQTFKHKEKHFASYIGIEITKSSPDLVEAKLTAREELSNRGGFLHGGAIMTLADTLGGVGTTLNLPKGFRTLTTESKTNFLSAIPLGETARAECTPVHRGKTLMVWQTKIFREDGKLAALITQSQLVIAPREPKPA
jgi:1,4-dihydroxy-2-naphthoyl-CoA hydrolase